jgi:tetratricopeptide (TPR) repeat protein
VAVLPFTNLGEDPANRAFCDGLTETLTSELTQLTEFQDALWVIPSTEIREEKITSAREARNSFGATLVISGSVQRRGGRVYLIANLVDTKALRQLRAVTIDTPIENLNSMQEDLIRQVAEMLEVKMKSQPKQMGSGGSTAVAAAYDFYLQGQGYLYRYDKAENLESAIRLFQQALQLDSQYALAYAGLAKAYWQEYDLTGDSKWVEPAKKNCLRAVELNDQLAPVRITLGSIEMGTGEYDEAILQFQKVLKLDPSSFDAYLGLAKAYDALGQLQKAESSYRAAIALQPNVWYGYNSLGVFYYNSSRYKEAAEMFDKVVQLLPDSARGYSNLGGVYTEMGRYDEAVPVLKKSIDIRPTSDGYWSLGYANFMLRHFPESAAAYEAAVKLGERQHYSILGNLGDAYYWSSPSEQSKARSAYEQAVQLANEELKINPRSSDALIMLAGFYAKLGNKDQSLENLRRALELKPDNPHFFFQAGLVYNQLGQPAVALDYLQNAVKGGYARAELNRIELDNLRENPRFRALTQNQQ